jgi:hypothetical protein
MSSRVLVLLVVALVSTLGLDTAAFAKPPCSGETTTGGAVFDCDKTIDGGEAGPVHAAVHNIANGRATETAMIPACSSNRPDSLSWDTECTMFHSCEPSGERFFSIWSRAAVYRNGARVSVDPWGFVTTDCLPIGSETEPDRPQITWAMVLREVKRVG